MTPEERKQQSIELLKKKKVPFIEWLPSVESASDITMRSKKEIAKRFVTVTQGILSKKRRKRSQ